MQQLLFLPQTQECLSTAPQTLPLYLKQVGIVCRNNVDEVYTITFATLNTLRIYQQLFFLFA
jgi:hypothetical protein